MTRPITVIAVDDDPLMREVLAELLTGQPDFDFVGAAADADAAIQLAQARQPDAALVDYRMPGGGECAAVGIRRVSPGTRVVALSMFDDRRAMVDMLRSGAVSYLVKGLASNAEILETVRRAADGEVTLPPGVAAEVIDELSAHLQRAHTAESARQAAAREVRNVLATRAVDMVFQPIVDLGTGRAAGVEALARFTQEPRRPPDVWFAAAAQAGVQVELESLAVERALAHMDDLPPQAYLALNLSPDTMRDARLQAMLLSAVPERTVVELTEHAPIDDYEAFRRAVEPLRTAGVRVAVDDAGAGFASLRHILEISPDLIKLDISLTRGIHEHSNQRALARALISFASETKSAVVAEGIEKEAEFTALRSLGVAYGQGYLLGRPAVPPVSVAGISWSRPAFGGRDPAHEPRRAEPALRPPPPGTA